MKTKLFSILFLIVSNICFSQSADTTAKNRSKEEVLVEATEMPEFPGGHMEMLKFIQANLTYPLKAREQGLGGKCFLKFVVGSTGIIRDIEVLKEGCPDCDKESIRIVKLMPKWKPGKQNGVPVSVYYNLPITFTNLNKH